MGRVAPPVQLEQLAREWRLPAWAWRAWLLRQCHVRAWLLGALRGRWPGFSHFQKRKVAVNKRSVVGPTSMSDPPTDLPTDLPTDRRMGRSTDPWAAAVVAEDLAPQGAMAALAEGLRAVAVLWELASAPGSKRAPGEGEETQRLSRPS